MLLATITPLTERITALTSPDRRSALHTARCTPEFVITNNKCTATTPARLTRSTCFVTSAVVSAHHLCPARRSPCGSQKAQMADQALRRFTQASTCRGSGSRSDLGNLFDDIAERCIADDHSYPITLGDMLLAIAGETQARAPTRSAFMSSLASRFLQEEPLVRRRRRPAAPANWLVTTAIHTQGLPPSPSQTLHCWVKNKR